MMAHGVAALLQQSIFGYILAFPTFLVLFERLSRVFLTFYHIEASIEILSHETVELTAVMPKYRLWDYTAGQYILLQVPAISYFQWHPFTISYSSEKVMKLLIKTDGDWTSKLRDLGPKVPVGINGPFGAPAQRFNDFQNSVIIGAGIGVTPFSAILADLQEKNDLNEQPQHHLHEESDTNPTFSGGTASATGGLHVDAKEHRRIDFHWIVRDSHYLSWLSNLLNQVSRSQRLKRERQQTTNLDIRINTHFTAKYNTIVTYVYSWLLEMCRGKDYPISSLTGLLNITHFGRPDFDKILDNHYESMRKLLCKTSESISSANTNGKDNRNGGGRYRVGVFYCGAVEVGVILADKCNELTLRGQSDGSKIEYYFMVEVFS
jgi:hypothetical protein